MLLFRDSIMHFDLICTGVGQGREVLTVINTPYHSYLTRK